MLKSVSSTWFVTVVQILIVFALTPYSIGILGDDRYGVWLTISSLTGYLGLIRGGLPAASVKFLSEAMASPNAESRTSQANRVVQSALYLYVLLALACVVIGGLMYVFWTTVGRPVPADTRWEARVAFGLAVVQVAFGFVAHLPYAVMEAHDDFVPRNAASLATLILQAALTFALLQLSASVIVLAATLLACSVFEIAVGVTVVLRKYPGARFGVRARDWALIRGLVHYSAWVLVLAVGGRLAFNTDAVIISTLSAYEDVAHYNVPNSLALYFMEFVAAIAIVVMPRAARLRAAGDAEGLRAVFLKWSKVSMALSLLVGLFLLFMGPEFIAFWIDDDYAEAGAAPLRWLIGSFLLFLPMRGAAIPVLMAVGDIRVAALAYAVMGAVNVALSVVLVREIGIVGAAIGTALPNMVFAAVVFQLACAEVGVGRAAYLRYVVLGPALASLPALAWLVLCVFVLGAEGLWGLAYSGVATVGLFGAFQLRYPFAQDPHMNLRAHPIGRRALALVGRA